MSTANVTPDQYSNSNFFGKLLNKQLHSFNENPFGLMAAYMIAQSCFGSIACYLAITSGGGYIPIGISVSLAMAANAFFIAQFTPKYTLMVTNISFIINGLMMVYYLVM